MGGNWNFKSLNSCIIEGLQCTLNAILDTSVTLNYGCENDVRKALFVRVSQIHRKSKFTHGSFSFNQLLEKPEKRGIMLVPQANLFKSFKNDKANT